MANNICSERAEEQSRTEAYAVFHSVHSSVSNIKEQAQKKGQSKIEKLLLGFV